MGVEESFLQFLAFLTAGIYPTTFNAKTPRRQDAMGAGWPVDGSLLMSKSDGLGPGWRVGPTFA
jgi:hypothetical protein